ncbi:MAG: hypothetical protein ACE5PO_00610 [Candidatus Bathyarchaeia archaeon]
MATIQDKPVTAFTLSLIGVVLQAIGAAFAATAAFYAATFWSGGMMGPGMMGGGMMGPWMMGGPWFWGFGWSPFFIGFGILALALGMLGVLWLNTSDVSRVKTGATLVLVASIIAFPTMFGFVIGSVLMFIGSILGLTWQPTRKE